MPLSRGQLVSNYNECIRKRDCYNEKINRNAALRNTLENGLTNCNSCMSHLGTYSCDANIFSMLYEANNQMFEQSVILDMLGLIDGLTAYLEGIKQQAQADAYVWQKKLGEFDAEESKRICAEQEAKHSADSY